MPGKNDGPLCECGARWYEIYGTCGNVYCDSDNGAARRRRMVQLDVEEIRRAVEKKEEEDME